MHRAKLATLTLVALWMAAWEWLPHGEMVRSPSIVGGVACAGGDEAAVAWLELRHHSHAGLLHVRTFAPDNRIEQEFELLVEPEVQSFRIADAGGGRFVLALESTVTAGRALQLYRFGRGQGRFAKEELPPLLLASTESSWQLAAAGDETVVAEELPETTQVSILDGDGSWQPPRERSGRTLIGAGGGHTVLYRELDAHSAELEVALDRPGGWRGQVSRPVCARGGNTAPTVRSVVGLRGGYARLAMGPGEACVDGIRDGRPFAYRRVPVPPMAAPELLVDSAGHLAVVEAATALLQRRTVTLPEQPGGDYRIDETAVAHVLDRSNVRYRLFGGIGQHGATALATYATAEATEVVFERHGGSGGKATAEVLGPGWTHQPDERPLLRYLAAMLLGLIALGAAATWRTARRLARIAPTQHLTEGLPIAIEGQLGAEADGPSGALRIEHPAGPLTLFVEGATVLRASTVRPRSAPRGDAVDVARAAPIVATGTVEAGDVYRGETHLRARPGDLVIVGCTLAEARALVRGRLHSSLVLFGLVALLMLSFSQ